MSGQKVAVIGSFGQVARALLRQGLARGQDIAVGGRPIVNMTAPATLDLFLNQVRPSLVINAAAYTAVDKAETEADAAFALNAEGPRYLATWCRQRGVPLFQVSTDYVFDGRKGSAYLEDDERNPLNVYGRSKAAGEDAVRAECSHHMIFRTAWVYGPDGQNFLKTMLRVGAERDLVRVVADQFGTPTSADDIASALLDVAAVILKSPGTAPWGTYHLVPERVGTWHDFAQVVFAASAAMGTQMAKLEAITTADYPTPATRPAYGVLDPTKIRNAFGIVLPCWHQRVADCVRQLIPPN
jgi:dTDP-4-dehydrorhamnose reductase